MGIDSDLIRGHIDTIILKILFGGDKYGYEICKEVEERSNGTYELKQPTLYSCLKRLEDKGFISSYWEDSDIGGKRHYYKLTDSGRDEYAKNQQEWIKSRSIIDDLISDTKPAIPEKEELNEETTEDTINQIEENVEASAIESSIDDTNDDTSPIQNDDISEDSSTEENYEEIFITSNDTLSPTSDNLEEESSTISTDEETEFTIHEEEIEDNYDIMSLLGHTPASVDEQNEINEQLEELETAQSILDSFDKKYSTIEDSNESTLTSDETPDLLQSEIAEEIVDINNEEYANQVETPSDDQEITTLDNTSTVEQNQPAFNFNDYLTSEESYFDSTDTATPSSFISPNIVIDGIDDKKSEEPAEEFNSTIAKEPEEVQEEKFISDLTPSYIKFDDEGNSHLINNTDSEDLYVDDSNIDYDEIYINPEEENSLEENSSSFMFETNDSDDNSNEVTEDTINNYQSEFSSFDLTPDNDTDNTEEQELQTTDFITNNVQDYTSQQSQTYETFTPKYTDEEYKQMLNQLESVKDNTITQSQEQKIQMFNTESLNKNINKDYADLKTSLSEEGFTVRPHLHLVKESKETKNYIQSNKIKLIQSWITFGFITCFIAVMYLILQGSQMYAFDIKYFLIGMGITIIPPAIYTILYIFNPHKKHIARFIPKASYIISILLTVQLLILVYCINLQLGFYSFTQEFYNHLYWIIPSIISLYPIVQTIIYHILYNSKRFHI